MTFLYSHSNDHIVIRLWAKAPILLHLFSFHPLSLIFRCIYGQNYQNKNKGEEQWKEVRNSIGTIIVLLNMSSVWTNDVCFFKYWNIDSLSWWFEETGGSLNCSPELWNQVVIVGTDFIVTGVLTRRGWCLLVCHSPFSKERVTPPVISGFSNYMSPCGCVYIMKLKYYFWADTEKDNIHTNYVNSVRLIIRANVDFHCQHYYFYSFIIDLYSACLGHEFEAIVWV